MTVQERIDLLEEAKELLGQVIENIETALSGTSHERHADAYLVGHLKSWQDSSFYCSRDTGIQQYIDELMNEENEEE